MSLLRRGHAFAFALASVWLALPQPAQALLESCTVSAQPTAFGNYNPITGTALDTTGQVTVTCTAVASIAVSYTIKLSAGGSGTATARRMSGSSATLPYNLYTDSTRSTVWGDGTGGTGTVSDSYALGLLQVTRNYSVYGRMPGGAIVPAGSYADTLTVTVSY